MLWVIDMLNQLKRKRYNIWMLLTFYGHSRCQVLPYGEMEMWHGHPDLYMICLEELLNTSDDKEIGYFLEVDLEYPAIIKEKTKNFPFSPENKKN